MKERGRQEQREGESWWSQFGGARWKVDFTPPEERRQHTHFPAALPQRTKVCPDFITGLCFQGAAALVSGSSGAAED